MKRFQESATALGSSTIMTLLLDDEKLKNEIFDSLWDQITNFEKRFSRFLDDSELSHFNNNAGKNVQISKQFRSLLISCQELSIKTNGLFNPFILPALQTAGYIGSWPNPSNFNKKQDYRDRQLIVSIDDLEIFDDKARIPKQSALDFGGIGKGYLLDLLSNYLRDLGQHNYWLSIGGDIICSGKDLDNQPWSIAVQSASNSEQVVALITNKSGKSQAIATSGVTKRKGTKGGKHWHHILNPQTGEPAKTDLLTSTVITKNATNADVFAKCIIILGLDESNRFMQRNNISEAYLQTINGQAYYYKNGQRSLI